MIWSSPIYRFREPYNENSVTMKEVVIDVTGSAPPILEPSDNLKQVLNEVFTSSEYSGIETVLEFGAAKLKNIPFILKQGKSVTAVEFKELADNKITKKNITKCKRYGSKFQELIFPNPFLTDPKRFDLVLLANVVPVMPIPSERLYLLDILHKKVNDSKYVLWIAQKEGSYKTIREEGRQRIGDGIWMGVAKRFKTFYRYHNPEEVDEIMQLYGFERIKKWSLGDDARLYKKIRYNLFTGMITPELIQEHIPLDETIEDPQKIKLKRVKQVDEVVPNPPELSIENLYKKRIQSINEGTTDAELYHRVVSNALSRIFRGSLRNMEIKVPVNNGTGIIDTVFTNMASSGFFNNKGEHVIVEVKNISGDPENTEFNQLASRLNVYTGHFGILVCRKVQDEDAVVQRCKAFLPQGNTLIFLTDKDIFELLDCSRNGNTDEINDIMDNRTKKITF